ncbi:hypothetical protein PhCBS80983_g05673 [Powellomyces hirtus]|uniref:Phosphodiesterase n=1 Tax=Powellomyces hirtus TaxID=109895 RepID=A0A507DTS2_9FUNG|nr:hypothetical protein PhCBS80983_g05673 [Powellomyces hirtus]
MSRLVHLLIQATPPRRETVDIPESTRADEVQALLFAAADVGHLAAATTALKVRAPDGSLLPASATALKPNGAEDSERYTLDLCRSDKSLTTLPTAAEVTALQQTLAALRSDLDQISLAQSKSGQRTPANATRRMTAIDPRYNAGPRYIFSEETKTHLKTPTFDPWEWQENEMLALLEYMFVDLGVLQEFKIDLPILRRFLQSIKDNYNLNHFHNFRHCFCVCHMMYAILYTTGVVTQLTPTDKLILLVACIGHDLDHPGYNNAYQINARTALATIYNDYSPLEMHHAAVLFTILRDPATNILATLPEPQFKEIRKGVIRCILATDMARHGEILATFKKYADEGFTLDDADHKSCLLQMVTKCADISNEVRPPDVADPWVDCLLEEFFEQADREKKEGLPWAPFMDREKVTKPNAQVGFIGFVMIPLYELVSRVLPNMDPIITPVKSALTHYKGLLEKEKAAAAAGAAATATASA